MRTVCGQCLILGTTVHCRMKLKYKSYFSQMSSLCTFNHKTHTPLSLELDSSILWNMLTAVFLQDTLTADWLTSLSITWKAQNLVCRSTHAVLTVTSCQECQWVAFCVLLYPEYTHTGWFKCRWCSNKKSRGTTRTTLEYILKHQLSIVIIKASVSLWNCCVFKFIILGETQP